MWISCRNDAITTCAKCGSEVCQDCASLTAPLKDTYGVLCLSCYKKQVSDDKKYLKK